MQAAVNLCKVVESEVASAIQVTQAAGRPKTSAMLQMEKPNFTATMHGAVAAFGLLIQALGKLSGPADRQDVGHVTYHLVCLYGAAMKTLHQRCKAKAETDTANKTAAKPPRQKRTTKSTKSRTGHQTDAPVESGDEMAIQITHLLGTMALSLNVFYTEHQDLLEGFLHILLSRVGKLLCLFVFQDLRLRPDLYADPAKLPEPEGLEEADLGETALLAAQLEAIHLIWLLERIMALLNADPCISTEKDDGRTRFVSITRKRLQSTLLLAVYGPDRAFKDPLQHPAQSELDSLQAFAQVSDRPVSDWFTQEVWRLLGWEMLAEVDHED